MDNLTTPRFNFVQLISFLWLVPLAFMGTFVFTQNLNGKETYVFSIIGAISGVMLLGFFFKLKWIRYLLGIIALLLSAFIAFLLYEENHIRDFRNLSLYICYFTFVSGVWLLVFNYSVDIEFNRFRHQPIDYKIALKEHRLSSFLFNQVDLVVCIGLIFLAPAIILIMVLTYEILYRDFNMMHDEDDFYLLAMVIGYLVCVMGFLFKMKHLPYFILVLTCLVELFFLAQLDGSSRRNYQTLGLMLSFAIYAATFYAMIVHPMTQVFMEKDISFSDDYDDIIRTSL